MYRSFLFRLVKWIIRKYFNDGLNPILGSNEMKDKIIAWKWMFYDEEYELTIKKGEFKNKK